VSADSQHLTPAGQAGPSAATPGIARCGMRTGERAVPFCCGLLFLLLAGVVLACENAALSQLRPQPKPMNLSVTITPRKATLFAGETQVFVATVVGGGDRTVAWSVDEEDGGTVTNQGLYTAPKVQGVYHVTATSTASPQRQVVATVTVLTYCDAPATSIR